MALSRPTCAPKLAKRPAAPTTPAAKQRRGWVVAALLAGLALFCSGCLSLYDPEASQEQNSGVIATVREGETVGQTFVSRRPRLNGIGLRLGLALDSPTQEGTLTASLYHTPQDATPITSISLPFSRFAKGEPLTVDLPIQADSAGQPYYLELSTPGGLVQVMGRGEDVYPKGNATQNEEALDADAFFQLYYQYDWRAALNDTLRIVYGVWLLLPLGVMLLVPGFLVLDLLGIGKGMGGVERLALYLGSSLAIVPIAMTWTSLVGIRWGSTGLWLAAGVLCAMAVWRIRGSLLHPRVKISGIGLAMAGVFLVSLYVRIAMVRDLSAPPWVDSVHHGVITRLILDNGGFPDNYLPYIDINSAQYHAGFHSLTAVFIWLTDLELLRAMLVFGQVLNALMTLAVYLLAANLTGSRTAGVFAALLTGIFTTMPAYYTSWGRYTHLSGLLILPTAFVLTRLAIEGGGSPNEEEGIAQPKRWALVLAAGIAGAGVFLTHYRVVLFLACLVLAYLVIRALTERRWASLLGDLGIALAAAVIAALLVLPWLPETITNLVLPRAAQWSGRGVAVFNTFAWTYLTAGLGRYTIILAGAGLVLALLLRRWFALTLLLWVGLLFAFANLERANLPGAGFINNASVQISLFMPMAVLGGFLLTMVVKGLGYLVGRLRVEQTKAQMAVTVAVVLTVAAATVVGARTMIPLLNSVTFLYRQADTQGMEWIKENIPPSETILVNTFPWGYGLYAGNDGGYWISALAGPKTMPPPVLYGLTNEYSEVKAINQLNRQVLDKSGQPAELAEVMRQAGLKYVYIGAKGGALSAKGMLDSGMFEELYHGDGTALLKLKATP